MGFYVEHARIKMPPKKVDPKAKTASKSQKPKAPGSGSKAKKKKWSKGKVRDKLANEVFLTTVTEEKLYTDIKCMKVITPSVVSERLKVNGSLARSIIKRLEGE